MLQAANVNRVCFNIDKVWLLSDNCFENAEVMLSKYKFENVVHLITVIMGKCCSTAPTDYGELSTSDIEKKPTPRGAPMIDKPAKSSSTISNGSTSTTKPTKPAKSKPSGIAVNIKKRKNGKYRKISDTADSVSQSGAVLDTPALEGFNVLSTYYKDSVSIDEHIVIEDMMKIYDPEQDAYVHYGVLLNHRQCTMYLVDPHHFAVWQQFERRTKMRDIFCSKRNSDNVAGTKLTFTETDAAEMVRNLISSKSSDSVDTQYAVQFIAGKSKYELQRAMLRPTEWNLTLSTILKLDDKAIPKLVDHIVITEYEEDDIPSMLQFFRWNGLMIRHRFVHDDDEEALHLILLNEIESSSIKPLNRRLKQFMVNDDELDHTSCRIHMAAYYEQIVSGLSGAAKRRRDDVKVIDLQSRFVLVDIYNDYSHDDADGFLYGFCMQSAVDEDDQNEEFLCILDDNNRVQTRSLNFTHLFML